MPEAWNGLRLKKPKVEGHHLTWFQEHIPRASFITWLVVLNKLPPPNQELLVGIICSILGVNSGKMKVRL